MLLLLLSTLLFCVSNIQVSSFHHSLLISSAISAWKYVEYHKALTGLFLFFLLSCCPPPHGAPVIAAVPLDIIDWPCNGYAELFLFRPQGRVQIENGALSIAVLNLSDSGMYQCVAENKHGIIYSSAQLMVLGKIASLLLLLSCLSVCAFDHLLR